MNFYFKRKKNKHFLIYIFLKGAGDCGWNMFNWEKIGSFFLEEGNRAEIHLDIPIY